MSDPSIGLAQNLPQIIKSGGGSEKKVVAREIFGSNLGLHQKKVVVINRGKSPYPSAFIDDSLHKTQWTAVQAAHQMTSKKSFSCVMAWLYNQARTFFQSES